MAVIFVGVPLRTYETVGDQHENSLIYELAGVPDDIDVHLELARGVGGAWVAGLGSIR